MEQKTENNVSDSKKLAVIRIRGLTGIRTKVNDTLKILRLYKNNYCCILPNDNIYVGMLKKAKDYITWGEIDDETFKMLIEKRGEKFNGREIDSKKKIKYNDFFIFENKQIKKYFRLNPPRKGFERKGIKHSYQQGGALGYRGENINDLIKRMI
ncbi:50S ribosomal protein L30 [Candidatus Woesearchaeota archaeon]|nr:50S ribosomal protein L30 [Candidatus Woesearchaeota archaeon]